MDGQWYAAKVGATHKWRSRYGTKLAYRATVYFYAGKGTNPVYETCPHHHLTPASAKACADRAVERSNRLRLGPDDGPTHHVSGR